MSTTGEPPAVRRGGRQRTRARQQSRMMRQREHRKQVVAWIEQFDVNRSGALEREELRSLLTHLHPDSPPDDRALDLLITQATEIRSYTVTLKGDPHGAVGADSLWGVTCGYATYVLASAAFSRLDRTDQGVIALRDLPTLMREAAEGRDCDKSDVDFVIDSLTENASVTGLASTLRDDNSSVSREELIPAFAAWKISQMVQDQDGSAARVDASPERSSGGGELENIREGSEGSRDDELDPGDWDAGERRGPGLAARAASMRANSGRGAPGGPTKEKCAIL